MRLIHLCLGLFLAILGNPARAQSETEKMLQGLPYDRDKLLGEVEDTPGQLFNRPGGAPVRPSLDASDIALILPLDAEGYLGEVANAFLEGFAQSAESYGDIFTLETYRTAGTPASALEAYEQAVADGARFIVGPLLRSSVKLIADLPDEEVVPTILLQEPPERTFAGQLGARPLYSYALGADAEIGQFTGLAVSQYPKRDVFVLVQPAPLGKRLADMFGQQWQQVPDHALRLRRVENAEAWLALHKELRGQIELPEEEEKGEEQSAPVTEEEDELYPPAVFVAGDSEFASQARAHVPSALPVYMLANFAGGLDASGRSLLGLSGVRYFEMPYVLDVRQPEQELPAQDYARALDAGLQRYVAAGADAYSIVRSYPDWGALGVWRFTGMSGTLQLQTGRFVRSGLPLEIEDGLLTPLKNLAEGSGFVSAAEGCEPPATACEL